MSKILLVFMLATGLGMGCGTDDGTPGGSNPLTMTPTAGTGCDACKGVDCPNAGTCHVEEGKPICIDACAAVICANGPCVVKDGKPVCTSSPTGTGGGGGDCRSAGCARPSTCEPCKTTTGAIYVCLPPGTVC